MSSAIEQSSASSSGGEDTSPASSSSSSSPSGGYTGKATFSGQVGSSAGATSNSTEDAAANQGPPVEFNSTIKFTVNGTSAMLDLDTLSPFRYDPDTGARQNPAASRSGSYEAWFVGTGYSLNGKAAFRKGYPTEFFSYIGSTNLGYTSQTRTAEFRNASVNPGDSLGTMSDLSLASYKIEGPFSPAADLTFLNATFDIPITTQAENFTALQSQAKTIAVTQGDSLNPQLDCEPCSVMPELIEMTAQRQPLSPNITFERPAFGPKYEVVDGNHLLLWNSTELVYKLPQNTTLVEVLGPVGEHPKWVGNANCYATLDPRPPWWNGTNFPLSTSKKAVNMTDQTMFVLPLPPNIQYTLRVGALGQENTCPVSSLRTYPFHFTYESPSDNSTNGTNSADVAGTGGSGNNNSTGTSSPAEASQSSKSNNTGVIVGVVVGVVGGLLLLGLAFWLWRRKRKEKQENEKKLMAQPYAERGSGQDVHKGSFLDSPDTENANGSETAADAPVAGVAGGRRSPIRHLVQEEDAEEVYEYLPPRYREAWQQGPSGSSSPPSTPPPGSGALPSSSSSAPAESQSPLIPPEKQRMLAPGTVPVDSPPLKEEYARAFGAASSSGSLRGRPTAPGGPRPLEDEYKRRFDPSPSPSPSLSASPSPSRPQLVGDYKEAFPTPEAAPTPPLEEDYKRTFDFGSAGDAPSQGSDRAHGR